jgi:hypothetical protein
MKNKSGLRTPKSPGSLTVLASPPLMGAGEFITRLRGRSDAATGMGQQWYVPPRVTTLPVQGSTINCVEPGIDSEHISRIEFDRLLRDKAFVSARRMNDGNQCGIRKHPLLNELKSGTPALVIVSIPEIYGFFTFARSYFTNRQPLPLRIVSLVPEKHDDSTLGKYLVTCVDGMQLRSMIREVQNQVKWGMELLKNPALGVQRISFSLDELREVSADSYALGSFYEDLFAEFLTHIEDVISGSPIPTS